MTGEGLRVPDGLDVPGLHFRRFRGEEDLLSLVEVYEAVAREDAFDWVLTVDRLRNEYEGLPNFDPNEDVVIAEVNGKAVGYAQIYWFQEVEGIFAAAHRERVLPQWRGRGITRALLAINTSRARELAGMHAEGDWRMGTMTSDTEVHRTRVLESSGYNKERWYLEMLRDLREPIEEFPLPEGIEVRPVEVDDQRKVFEALWEAFRGSWAFREMDEKDWTGFQGSPEFQPEHWVVGWDGEVVAGVVFSWVDQLENQRYGRLWGYNDEVGVTEGYRRRGLAKALLSRSLVILRELGMEYANLGVDTQNPADALGLYESQGYVVRKEHYDMIRPMGE
jgi:GNAT superfamily N-acetyltransferase